MCMENRYREIIGRLPARIRARKEKGQITALGYTSDLDILSSFQPETLSKLLELYLPGEDLAKMQAQPFIHSMEDFLRTIVFYCAKGIGGEADIDDISMIRPYFEEEYGIGGTGVQAALALSSVGADSLVHLTDDSPEVCRLLGKRGVFSVDDYGNMIPVADLCQRNPQEVHYIIQFQKGQSIRSGSQRMIIPVSNRLIVTKATVNHILPLFPPFFRYIEKHAADFTSLVLSSFNSIQDEALLRERIETVLSHLSAYRSANPGGVVFFDDAAYHNETIRKKCKELLYGSVDIVSMNEEELSLVMNALGKPVDTGNPGQVLEAACRLRDMYRVRQGMIVHTKDYALYTGENDLQKLEEGLVFGNVMATAKALTGKYATMETIEEVMKIPMSPAGLAFRELTEDMPGTVVVPSRLIERPKYTIGLGDSFVAGVQLCFT